MKINTKKTIALAVIGTTCVLAVWQAYWTKQTPTEFIALASAVTGYYFGYGKGKADTE